MSEKGKGMCTPLGCNSMKSVLICTVAGFIFFFAYNFVVHGHLLISTYALTPQLWRPEADMHSHFTLMLVMYAVLVYVAADIYGRFSRVGGTGEGVRFGLLLGLFIGCMDALPYVWMPISGTLAVYWFLAGFGQGLGLGVLFAMFYKAEVK